MSALSQMNTFLWTLKMGPVLPLVWMLGKSLQSSLILGDPMDRGPPGSSVHGILQARVLEGGPTPSSRGPSRPGVAPASLVFLGGFFAASATWEARITLCYNRFLSVQLTSCTLIL